MASAWMVRAGEGGELVEAFGKGFVAIGYGLGDMTGIGSREAIRDLYRKGHPDAKPSKAANAVAMLPKFRVTMQPGDHVVTYDPTNREYLVGIVQSDYFYEAGKIKGLPHLRKVKWEGRVSRDLLPVSARNTLGAFWDCLNWTKTSGEASRQLWLGNPSRWAGGTRERRKLLRRPARTSWRRLTS